MSLLTGLLGKQIGDGVGAAAGGVIEALGNVFDKLFTSDEEKAAARVVMEKLRQRPDELQVEINKIEAAHPSVFVAGWRPAIGWVCALSLFAYYPPRFIAATVLWIIQVVKAGAWIPPPEVGISDIIGLVLSMLGMGYLRTREKESGVAR